jgi:type III secretory pathway component EscV
MNIILFLLIVAIIIFLKIEFKKAIKNKQKYNNDKSKKKEYRSNYTNIYKQDKRNNIHKNEEKNIMNTTNIAKHFNISARELNKIFEELQWAYKENRWWLATELGIKKGAKEFYDVKTKTKYIKWNPEIINDTELIKKIYDKKPKQNENVGYSNFYKKPKQKINNKKKGDDYEKYIADFFRKQNYYVWEHGKEKGVKDSSIDLIIKKDKFIFFVQCKNWENWKINHKEVKATRTDVREYLKKEKNLWNLIKNYKSKILYVTPKKCLSKSAYTYIKENHDVVEYQVIPIENNL